MRTTLLVAAVCIYTLITMPNANAGILKMPTISFNVGKHYVGVQPETKRVTTQSDIKFGPIEAGVGLYDKKVSASNVKVFGVKYENGRFVLPNVRISK